MPQDPLMPQTPQPKAKPSIDEWEEQVRQKYNIPQKLWRGMAAQESGGDRNAISPTGVRGKYQVTESTAKSYGLDRNDPYQQAEAAAKHLRKLYDTTPQIKSDSGRWWGAVAKYYGGDNAVDEQGNFSDSSIDGVSTPLRHVNNLARRIQEMDKQSPSVVNPQNPAAPMVAPAPKPAPMKARPKPVTTARGPIVQPTQISPLSFTGNAAPSSEKLTAQSQQIAQQIRPEIQAKQPKPNPFEQRSPVGQLAEMTTTAFLRGAEHLNRGVSHLVGMRKYVPTQGQSMLSPQAQNALGQQEARQDEAYPNAAPIYRGIVQGATEAPAYMLGGAAGTIPAMATAAGLAAIDQDWQNDPKRAAVRTALGSVLPIAGGKALSSVAGRVAPNLVANSLGGRAVETVGGALGNVAPAAAEQLYYDRELNLNELGKQAVIGGALGFGTYVHPQTKTMRARPEPHPVDVSKAIMDVGVGELPPLPETPPPTTQAEAPIPPTVPPEVPPTAPAQPTTKPMPPRPGEARIPQATEGTRGGIVPRRPGDTIQRPVGPSRIIADNRSAENATPTTLDDTLMFAERPAVARNMKAEGERVIGEQAQRVAEGTLKEGDFRGPKRGTAKNPKFGQYGDVAYALGRSPYQKTPGDVTRLHSNAVDIPPTESGEIWQKGANAVIGDPEVKAALDLPPEANQEAVRDAVREDVAKRMGLPPDVSLAQVPPNVWLGWARSKGFSPGLIARMNKSIELARGKTGGDALPPNETPQTPMATRQATRPSEGEPIPFKRGTTNVEETPAARTAQPEQPETPMRSAPEAVPEVPAMGEAATQPAPTGAKVPRTRKPKPSANDRFVEPSKLVPENVAPVAPVAPEPPVASTLAPKTRKAKAVTLPRTTEPESVTAKANPKDMAPVAPRPASRSSYTIQTEDRGDIPVHLQRWDDGSVTIVDYSEGGGMPVEYNAAFAKSKSEQDLLRYVYETLGITNISKPSSVSLEPKDRSKRKTRDQVTPAVKSAPETMAEAAPVEPVAKTAPTTTTKKASPPPLPGKPKYNEATLREAGFEKVDSQLYKAQDGRSLEYDPDHSVWQIKRPSGEGTETFSTQKEAIESILGKPPAPVMEAPVRGAKKVAPTVTEKAAEAKGKRAAKKAVVAEKPMAEKPVVEVAPSETKTASVAKPERVTPLNLPKQSMSRSNLDSQLKDLGLRPAERQSLLDEAKSTEFRYEVPGHSLYKKGGTSERKGQSYSVEESSKVLRKAYAMKFGEAAVESGVKQSQSDTRAIAESNLRRSDDFKVLKEASADLTPKQIESIEKQASDAGITSEVNSMLADYKSKRTEYRSDPELRQYLQDNLRDQQKQLATTNQPEGSPTRRFYEKRIQDLTDEIAALDKPPVYDRDVETSLRELVDPKTRILSSEGMRKLRESFSDEQILKAVKNSEGKLKIEQDTRLYDDLQAKSFRESGTGQPLLRDKEGILGKKHAAYKPSSIEVISEPPSSTKMQQSIAKAAVAPKEVVAEKPAVAGAKPAETPVEPIPATSLPETPSPTKFGKAVEKAKAARKPRQANVEKKTDVKTTPQVTPQVEPEAAKPVSALTKAHQDVISAVEGLTESLRELNARRQARIDASGIDLDSPPLQKSDVKVGEVVYDQLGREWRVSKNKKMISSFSQEGVRGVRSEIVEGKEYPITKSYKREWGWQSDDIAAWRRGNPRQVAPQVEPEAAKPSPAETPPPAVSEETKPIAGEKPSLKPKSTTATAKKPLADAIREGQEPKSNYTNVKKLREQGYTDKEIFKLAADNEEFDLMRAGSKPNIEATARRNAKGQPLDPSGEPYLKGTDGEYYTPQVTVRKVEATAPPAESPAIVPGVKPAKPRKTLAKSEDVDTSGPSRLKELKAKKAELAKKGGVKLTFGSDKEPSSGGTIMGGGFGSLQSLFEKAQSKRAKASPSDLPHYDKGDDYVKAVRELADKGKFTPEEKTLIENTAKRVVLGAESVPDVAAKVDAKIREIIGAKANPNVTVPKVEAAKPTSQKVEPVEAKTPSKKASTEPQTAEEYFQDQLDKDIWHSDKSGPANKANAEARAALAEAAAKFRRGKMTDEQKARIVGAAQDLMLAGKLGDDQLITNARKALKNASLNDSRAAKIWEGIKTSGRTIQTLRYGTDWSLGFKQAGPLTTNIFNVVDTAKAFKYAAGASKSQNRANEIHAVLESHPRYDDAQKSGLELTLFGKHEEVYQDNPAMKVPWIKRLEAGNNALVDYMRLQEFGKMTSAIDKQSGLTEVQKADSYKRAAEVINTLTGRTNLGEGKLQQVATALNGIMASPRLNISRFKMADPLWIPKMYAKDPVVAKQMFRQAMGVASTWMGMYALGATTGAFKVVLNPNDSDFGKVVIGKTRYDMTGGMLPVVKILLQYGRLGHAIANEAYENTDESKAKRQAVWSKTAYDTTQFLRGRLGPLYGYATDIVLGKDFEKRSVTLRSTVNPTDPNFAGYRLVPPLGVTGAYESYQMEGMKGVAKTAIPEFVGIGARTYGQRPGYIGRDSRVAQEMDDVGLPASQITRMPKEPNDVYKNRTLTVDEWTTTYGERLINSPEYKAMSNEMKVETLKELRSRITAESRKAYTKGESPDLNKLAPSTIMTSVTAAQKRLREKTPREFVNTVK